MNRMTHRLGALIAVALLAACGGGDDEPAAGDATVAEPDDDAADQDAADSDDGDGDDAVTPPPDEEEVDDSDDGDTIVIDDFDDIPSECVDIMVDFLRAVEPTVSAFDWESATVEDLEQMGTSLDVPTDDFDRRSAEAGCDRYEIGADDEQSLEFALEVAERDAPGTVGWLQFLASFAGLGDTVDDVTNPDDGSAAGTGDCEDTQNLLLEKAEEYETFENVPVAEITELTTLITALTQVCTIAEIEAFYENPAITAFLEG